MVIDTETTGDGPDDEVVEVGYVLMTEGGVTIRSCQAVVRSEVPVKPEARAAHHLTDEQIADGTRMRDLVCAGFFPPPSQPVVSVAHYMEFDARLLLQSGYELPKPRVCTLICARHLWPEMRHSNQVLRYALGLEVDVPRDLYPHRALYDAVVTAALLRRMLMEHTLDDLVRLTETPVLQTICKIGKWRDRPWSEVDVGMLRWILTKDFDADVMYAARHYLNLKEGRLL
jgi:exodeoxyribonuclease X